MSSFLQSNEWMEFQRSLGREVFEYDKDGISAKIVRRELPFHKSYLYVPYGPEVYPVRSRPAESVATTTSGRSASNGVNNFVAFLKQLGKENKSVFVKAEPLADNVAQELVETRKFKKSKKEIQPSRTVAVDISGSEDEILERMHNKTRYNIKLAERHGIRFSESNDVDIFWKLMQKTTRRDRFSSHPKDYYQKLLNAKLLNIHLFLAYHGDDAVAGAILLIHGNAGYYLHGASDHNYRALMSPYMLHWQIIKFLKQNGISEYDLWGINANKWPGVTRFKLGWGGKTVEYPGSFNMSVSGFWYFLYRVYKKLVG